MKKVLYVATVLSHICQFHLPYLKMFKEQGYEVHVAARDNLAEKNGLQLKYADKHFEIPFQRSPFSPKNITSYKQLKKLIDKEQYDLIICNTPVGGIVTRMAVKKARKKGTKVVYIAHGFHFYKGAPKKNWLIYYPIEKHFAKKCDIVVTITNEDYELALKKFKTTVVRMHGVGVDGVRHCAISNEEKTILRNELHIKEIDFICLCTGELNENKNQKSLIQLVPQLQKRIPNFRLWLAGNGPLKEELETEIQRLGLQNCVKLLGYQPVIERYVRASDVVLSASKREGLPFNIIEAMLAKRPVVASINRGHRELISDGENGFMTNDQTEFVEDIVKLYQDKALYEKIAEKAFKNAQSYTIIATMEEFKQILGVGNE
jgi:glycosyltransferase EpsD